MLCSYLLTIAIFNACHFTFLLIIVNVVLSLLLLLLFIIYCRTFVLDKIQFFVEFLMVTVRMVTWLRKE